MRVGSTVTHAVLNDAKSHPVLRYELSSPNVGVYYYAGCNQGLEFPRNILKTKIIAGKFLNDTSSQGKTDETKQQNNQSAPSKASVSALYKGAIAFSEH